MKKTLCYKMEIVEPGYTKNEGFIFATIVNDKLVNIEGVFTLDYLKADISGEYINITYYSPGEDFKILEEDFCFSTLITEFEIPINNAVLLDSGRYIEMLTLERISGKEKLNSYMQILNEFKLNNVFEEEPQ